MMITKMVSMKLPFFVTTHMNEVTQLQSHMLAMSQTGEKGYDSPSQQTGQVAEMAKRCSPSQPDVIFVVMSVPVNVLVDDVLIHSLPIEW